MQPQNPYDFIMDPTQKRQPSGPGLHSEKNKKLIMVVFILVFLVVLAVGVSFLLSLGKANNQDLIELRAEQTEILRIIDLGKKDITDGSLKNRLASMQAFISSDGLILDDLLGKREVLVTKIQLDSKKDSDVDSALEKALQEGSLDTKLLEVVSDRSNSYYKTLKSSLAEATTKIEKDLLNTLISNLEKSATN